MSWPWLLWGLWSLDGSWGVAEARPGELGPPAAPVELRPLPSRWHHWGWDTHRPVWHRKRLVLPRALPQAFLELGGADYLTELWWDGRRVGAHEGGSSAFRFALGPQAAGPHEIWLRVEAPFEAPGPVWSLRKRAIRGVLSHHDTRPGGAWDPRGQDHNAGGIWGRVRLRGTGPTALGRLALRSGWQGGQGWLALAPRPEALPGATAQATWLEAQLQGEGGQGWTRRWALRPGQPWPDVRWRPAGVRPWWSWDQGRPQTYRLRLRLGRGAELWDQVERRVGFRTLRQDARGHFWLNGRRVFLRGVNYISSPWPGDEQAPRLRQDAALIRGLNANAVRVHAHLEPEAFYEACDAQGLLVWQDLPLQWGYEDSPAVHAAAEAIAREGVAALEAHPSVVLWCAHNEAPYSAEWMKWKYRDYDPKQNLALDERLVQALREEAPEAVVRANSPTEEHPWLGWYSGRWQDYAKPTRAPLITEFGAQALPSRARVEAMCPPWARWPQSPEAWDWWAYHNFQRRESFQLAGLSQGRGLDDWIREGQAYQALVHGFAAQQYRAQRFAPVGAIFQFHLLDPWPSAAWGIHDDLRQPKAAAAALREAYAVTLPFTPYPERAASAGQPLALPLAVAHDGPQALGPVRLDWSWWGPGDRPLAAGARAGWVGPSALWRPDGLRLPPGLPGPHRLELRLWGAGGRRLLGQSDTAIVLKGDRP